MSKPVTPEAVRKNEHFLRALEADLLRDKLAVSKVVFSARIAKVVVDVLNERGNVNVVVGYSYGGAVPKAYVRRAGAV